MPKLSKFFHNNFLLKSIFFHFFNKKNTISLFRSLAFFLNQFFRFFFFFFKLATASSTRMFGPLLWMICKYLFYEMFRCMYSEEHSSFIFGNWKRFRCVACMHSPRNIYHGVLTLKIKFNNFMSVVALLYYCFTLLYIVF